MKFAGEDGEEELDSDDEEFPDYLVDEMDPDAMRQYRAGGGNRKQQHIHDDNDDDEDYDYEDEDSDVGRFVAGGAKNAAVGPLSAEAREALELQFERTMQEYDDNEIGYLSDVSRGYLVYRCDVCVVVCEKPMLPGFFSWKHMLIYIYLRNITAGRRRHRGHH